MAAKRIALAGLILGTGLVAGGAAAESTQPIESVEPGPPLRISAKVLDSDLLAAGAITDSLEEGARRVLVRVVDEMVIEIAFEAQDALTLPGPLDLCLTGPYWAPDDAGLSDRCWGQPDLTELVAMAMPADADGLIHLAAGEAVVVMATLRHGHVRCDYPPGTWNLEVEAGSPRSNGGPREPLDRDVPFDVSPAHSGPLRLLGPYESRYCGLAGAVLRDQGEPEVVATDD